VGPRGSGKSTVARLLGERLHFGWIDADEALAARAGLSVRAIFEAEGEAGFRRREGELLRELCNQFSRRIIATGGGIVLQKENRDLLRSSGFVIWLTGDVDTLWRRVSGDANTAEQRPNLTVGGREEVAEVLAQREPLYRAVADHVVDTTGRLPQEVVDDILAWLREP
jgi:shikimate kinase